MATYLVSREGAAEGELPRMVEHRTKIGAINHVAKDVFGAVPLTTKEALKWAEKGVKLEEPNAEE